jgi:hypothetical protein
MPGMAGGEKENAIPSGSYRAFEVRHGQLFERPRWQVLSDMHTKVNQLMIVLFPQPTKKYHGIKIECSRFCTTSERAKWSHRRNAGAEEPRAL